MKEVRIKFGKVEDLKHWQQILELLDFVIENNKTLTSDPDFKTKHEFLYNNKSASAQEIGEICAKEGFELVYEIPESHGYHLNMISAQLPTHLIDSIKIKGEEQVFNYDIEFQKYSEPTRLYYKELSNQKKIFGLEYKQKNNVIYGYRFSVWNIKLNAFNEDHLGYYKENHPIQESITKLEVNGQALVRKFKLKFDNRVTEYDSFVFLKLLDTPYLSGKLQNLKLEFKKEFKEDKEFHRLYIEFDVVDFPGSSNFEIVYSELVKNQHVQEYLMSLEINGKEDIKNFEIIVKKWDAKQKSLKQEELPPVSRQGSNSNLMDNSTTIMGNCARKVVGIEKRFYVKFGDVVESELGDLIISYVNSPSNNEYIFTIALQQLENFEKKLSEVLNREEFQFKEEVIEEEKKPIEREYDYDLERQVMEDALVELQQQRQHNDTPRPRGKVYLPNVPHSTKEEEVEC